MKVETLEVQRLFKVMEEKNLSITEVITLIRGKNEFDLSVDYSRTVQEMIEAGNYDWTNNDITEKIFPLPTELSGQKTTVSSKLFHFNRLISSEDAINEMDAAGFRPATLAELLALGEAHPELQKEFPIVALSSVWRDAYGDRHVPVLFFVDYRRGLGLGWFGRDWGSDYRFLGVRK